MSKLESKLDSMTSGELYEVLEGLTGDTSEHAGVVYDKALDAVQAKVSEEKFTEICEKLEALEDAA